MEKRPPGYTNAVLPEIEEHVLLRLRHATKTDSWPVMMCGPTGTGKTSAAAVLYGRFQRLPMWHRADDLLLAMSMGRKDGVQVDGVNQFGEVVRRHVPFNKFVARVANCSCLFLDDLGVRAPTDAMHAALFDLLEWRLEKPLVVTTNQKMSELSEMFDDRIASRLSSGTVIPFTGVDRRQKAPVVRDQRAAQRTLID